MASAASPATCRGEAELAREQQATATAEAERLQASVYDVRGRVEQRRGEATSRRSAGAIVDALMAERVAGRLPGVHGRLGAAVNTPPISQPSP